MHFKKLFTKQYNVREIQKLFPEFKNCSQSQKMFTSFKKLSLWKEMFINLSIMFRNSKNVLDEFVKDVHGFQNMFMVSEKCSRIQTNLHGFKKLFTKKNQKVLKLFPKFKD